MEYSCLRFSGGQQSESVIHIHMSTLFKIFFSHIGRYRVLSTAPCAMQWVLISYLLYICQCVYGLPRLGSSQKPACQCKRYKRCTFSPGSGRSLGVGSGNPLQYSCLENSTDRGAWQVLQSMGS